MARELTKQELLAKAEKPGKDALRLHPFYRGKIETMPKCVVRGLSDFSIWYSPGVARACLAIKEDPQQVYELTCKWNTVAVVSDGTRVLGLGDIGPEAGMPVMEGKALLFKYLGGVDAVPICLDTKDPEKIIETVKLLQPSFGGINLEDIASPKCFTILDRLRKEMSIPVWHDDQQGTAAITLAGLINALKLVDKDIAKVRVTMVGAGAASIAISRLLLSAGVNPETMIMADYYGILYPGRDNLPSQYQVHMAEITNKENRRGGVPEAIKGADVVIAVSHPGPGTIKKEWLATMASDAILFSCANPIPEIWPWEAKEAGVRIVGTGRSDFPNQVNNSLGFPGIFRGALDVRAKTITDEMCIAAAEEMAACAQEKGLTDEYIVPTMDEWELFPREAAAVGLKAIEQGIARVELTREQLLANASRLIKRVQDTTKLLMEKGIIPPAPEEE